MKYILYLLILFCVAYAAWNIKGCTTHKQKAPEVQYINPLSDTVRHWKDAYGKVWAQVRIEENTTQAVMTMHKGQIDSLLRALKAKDRQLQEYEKIGATVQGSFQTVLVPVYDTIQGEQQPNAKEWEWHDDDIRVWGVVDSSDIYVSYNMHLQLTTVVLSKRKHHLFGIGWGKRESTVNVTCDNPSVTIDNLQKVKIN
jgi:hypothetical protein